ncbi:MAG: PQQ-binding-like beta-propeller repeat protein [Opitutaceae bacterium]|nr:PQQ-binding-like beta-propeller repeat protein [Verrucomicrobiales bacterium]
MNPLRPALVWAVTLVTAHLASAADWPQWLGPSRSGNAGSIEKPLQKLPTELKAIWRINVGGGFSSPVLAGGKLLYMDEDGANEVVHLVDVPTRKEIWKKPLAEKFQDEWGAGPRSTPMIDGENVYVQSCNGEFRCLKLSNGETVWTVNFEKDFGVPFLGSKAREGTASRRGNNGCGIVDGAHVIVPVGNTQGASIVCFDKLTGKVIWKALSDEAAYSSLKVATLAGVKQVVAYMADSLAGIERNTGSVLWRVPLKTNAKRHAATPLTWENFVAVNSHTFGQICFRIVQTEAGFKAEQAWANPATKINLATPVKVGGFLYSHGPAKNFICVDAATGAVKWTQPGFGREVSSTIAVGSTLLVLTDDGELVQIAADSESYRELARIQVAGKNWNYPAFADGKLYVRDQRELICYDLTAGAK